MVFERRLVLVSAEYGQATSRGNLVTLEIERPSTDAAAAAATTRIPLISAITDAALNRAMICVSISMSISNNVGLNFQLKPGDVVADMFGGAMIHSYNNQYAQVLRWYYLNKDKWKLCK